MSCAFFCMSWCGMCVVGALHLTGVKAPCQVLVDRCECVLARLGVRGLSYASRHSVVCVWYVCV